MYLFSRSSCLVVEKIESLRTIVAIKLIKRNYQLFPCSRWKAILNITFKDNDLSKTSVCRVDQLEMFSGMDRLQN